MPCCGKQRKEFKEKITKAQSITLPNPSPELVKPPNITLTRWERIKARQEKIKHRAERIKARQKRIELRNAKKLQTSV